MISNSSFAPITTPSNDVPNPYSLLGVKSDRLSFLAVSNGSVYNVPSKRLDVDDINDLARTLESRAAQLKSHLTNVSNPFKKEYSWAYPNFVRGKHSICVQWMCWQGAEYRIEFTSRHDRDGVIAMLYSLLNPDTKPLTRDAYTTSERKEFFAEVGFTIDPIRLLSVCPKDSRLVIIGSSLAANETLYGDNFRECIKQRDENRELMINDENVKLLSMYEVSANEH